jgi:hypothetical protein
MKLSINFNVGRELGDPIIKILIDDYLILYDGIAPNSIDKEFDIADGEHELKIVHSGKSDEDHLYNSDGTIKVDKFVYIDNIVIDSIKLLENELHEGKFWPVYSLSYIDTMIKKQTELPQFIQPNLYLGHNGIWVYKFFSPFTDWIIQKRNNGPKLENTIFKSSSQLLEDAKSFFNSVDDI